MKRHPLVLLLFCFLALTVSGLAQQAPAASPVPDAQDSQSAPPESDVDLGDPDAPDPLLDPPPLSDREKISLMAGVVKKIDPVRNQLVMEVFGGKDVKMIFDQRTRILRGGAEVGPTALRRGERIYVDTLLHQRKVFAKNIHIHSDLQPADATGQVLEVDPRRGRFTMRAQLTNEPVTFTLPPDAVVRARSGSDTELRPGALVAVRFLPGKGTRGVARDIEIIAQPGTEFTFWGTVTYLNIKEGVLALRNRADDKTYEIAFNPGRIRVTSDLGVGAEATVVAAFQGQGYEARELNVTRTASETATQQDAEAEDRE